jgi:hypothetical protein
MNQKLIRIAKYLANNGLYKEASEIKKVAEFWDDIDKHKKSLENSVKAVLGELKNLELNTAGGSLPENLGSWIKGLKKATECEWDFDGDPHHGTFVQELPRSGYLLQTTLICEDENSDFFGCFVKITTNTMRKKTKVIIGFPDHDTVEISE